LYAILKPSRVSDNDVVKALKICDILAKENYKEFDKDSLKKLYNQYYGGDIDVLHNKYKDKIKIMADSTIPAK